MTTLYWIDHLLWCLGKLYLALLRFDFIDAQDIFFFIRIHLYNKAELILLDVKIPFKRRFKNLLISLFGLLVSLSITVLIAVIIALYVL
jgi:hypothetical protein